MKQYEKHSTNNKNTVNTSTHITKTPTHYKTHTYTHQHITKQVKTTTVQDTPKWNSHNIIKYPQYKVTLMYDIFVNCNWVVTRWQKYSAHLHTNNTYNDTKQTIHRATQQFWKSAGRASSWLVIPWHLPYNRGKSTTTEEKARQPRKKHFYPKNFIVTHFTSLQNKITSRESRQFSPHHFTYLHSIPTWIPLLVTTFLTLFLSVFSLQGKDAIAPAGNWFQLLMVLFTKEYTYLPTPVLCFLVPIFRLWSSLLRKHGFRSLSPIAFQARLPLYIQHCSFG